MLTNIPRHKRDFYQNIFKTNNKVTINDQEENTLFYLPLINSFPLGSINASLDFSKYIIENSSTKLLNGYIPLGNVYLNKKWTLECFFYLNSSNPVFSIEKDNICIFSIRYVTGYLEISRLIGANVYDNRRLVVSLPVNEWFHLALVRNKSNLKLFINYTQVLEITDYYYNISKENCLAYIGKVNNDFASFNLSNFRLTNTNIYPSGISNDNNIASYTDILLPNNTNYNQNQIKLIDIKNIDTTNNSVLFPNNSLSTNNSRYSFKDYCWNVLPSEDVSFINNSKGLYLYSDLKHPKEYTLQCIFKLNENTDKNLIILANWSSIKDRYFYIIFNHNTSILKLVYFFQESLYTLNIGSINLSYWNSVALQTDVNNSYVYLNGSKKLTINNKIVPSFIKYKFNYNVDKNINLDQILLLKSFTLFYGSILKEAYLPFINDNFVEIKPFTKNPAKYHMEEFTLNNTVFDIVEFTISGLSILDPNTTNSYTIIQKGIRNYNVEYKISISYGEDNLFSLSDLNLSSDSLIINSENTSNSFTLTLSNFSYNKFRDKFKLIVQNNTYYQELEIKVNDNRTLDRTTVTSISGYIDGYLSSDSTVEGIIPNIQNNKNLTTFADRLSSDVYGVVYNLKPNKPLVFSESYSQIKTLFLVYKELENTSYRTYAGNLNTYSFNGGENYELIGNIKLLNSDYLKAFTVASKSFVFKINKEETTLVYINEDINKVFILEKDPVVGWNVNNALELNTGIAGTDFLQNASLSINSAGTAFALGMKNANNGEGVVQIWKKLGLNWIKDLHLGSPIPAPYLGGFGYSVAISEDATKLFSSEIYSNSVYLFNKTNDLWSAIPSETFTGNNQFGYQIESNSNGTELIVVSLSNSTASIYRYENSSWSLNTTLSNINNIKLNSDATYLVTSNVLDKQVKILKKVSGLWTVHKTISTTDDSFGYSVDIDDNNTIAVSTPYLNKVSLYKEIDEWTAATDIVENSDNYGYIVGITNYGVLISNYTDVIDLYTNNSDSIDQPIVKVRQGYLDSTLNSMFNKNNVQVLSFYSNTDLNIDRIGYGKSGTGLNGIFMACLLYSRVLNNSEINTVELFLKRQFNLDDFSLIL